MKMEKVWRERNLTRAWYYLCATNGRLYAGRPIFSKRGRKRRGEVKI